MGIFERSIQIENAIMRRILKKTSQMPLTRDDEEYQKNPVYRKAYDAAVRDVYIRLASDESTSLPPLEEISRRAQRVARIKDPIDQLAQVPKVIKSLTNHLYN